MPNLKSLFLNLYQGLHKAPKLAWTKRQFLGVLSVLAVTVSALSFGPSLWTALVTGTPVEATTLPVDTLLSLEREETAAIAGLAPLYKSSRSYLSDIYEAKHPFQLLGLHWQENLPTGTAANLEIRLRSPEGIWSEWKPLEVDHDEASQNQEKVEPGYAHEQWSYVIASNSTAFQYRADLSTANQALTPKLSDLQFDYVNGGSLSLMKKASTSLSKLVFKANPGVISRSDWGADESYRLAKTFGYDKTPPFTPELDEDELKAEPELANKKRVDESEDGEPLLWPLEYPKTIEKIIIHHTATTDFLDDPAAAVRAIYYYHAVSRGWGDIGYNFIVAPDGEVFEGRYGGEGVVGGHAHGHNTGSVGIALLGNYQESDLKGEMIKGLEGLLYQKIKLYDIDPDGSSEFHGETLPNIMGHRDVEKTACPGQNTYDFLPELRTTLARSLTAEIAETKAKGDYAFKEATDRELVTLEPDAEQGLTFKLKNTGDKTWDKATYLLVTARDDAETRVQVPVDSQKRSALMNETSVAPGKTATFNMKVKALKKGGFASFMIQPMYSGKFKTAQTFEGVFFVDTPQMDFTLMSSTAPKSLQPKESAEVTLILRNDSNFIWENSGADAVTLLQVGTSSLSSSSTLAKLKEATVKPGANGTFSFTIKAPTMAGKTALYFTPSIASGAATLASSAQLTVDVGSTSDSALVTALSTPLNFEPGETQTVLLELTNMSTKDWLATELSLKITGPEAATVGVPKLGFKTLKAGKTAKAYFTLKAPSSEGRYTLSVDFLKGTTKLLKNPMKLSFTVASTKAVSAPSFERPIRIKLTPDAGVGDPLLTADQDFSLYNGKTLLKTFKASSRIRVTRNPSPVKTGETFTVTSGLNKWTVDGPVRLVPAEDAINTVLTMSQVPAWNKDLNDNQFRGNLEVLADGDETVLVNELPLEDYLKGIGEVSNSDPTEKVKTIIVLARTYAVYYTTQSDKFPGKAYDLDDDPNVSQKYLGYGFEKRSSNVVEAVKTTKNQVVTYKKKVVKTPYFSKSDGVATKSAKDVWGWTDTPWLVSVPDTVCKATKFEGHGVGLSGCGATELAKQGKTFVDIIKTYYTGVEVLSLDDL